MYLLINKCPLCKLFGIRVFSNIKLDYYTGCELESWEVGQLLGGN